MKAMPIRILAIAGSLRGTSYNRAALDALQLLAPASVVIDIFERMAQLPLFNPDLEGQLPAPVQVLKTAVANADGLILASPEYAHGISGVMKNALDWLVSGEEFVNLPVALINTSPRATHAQAALREVVTTMSGVMVEAGSVAIPLLGSGLDARGIMEDPLLSAQLKNALQGFGDEIIRIKSAAGGGDR